MNPWPADRSDERGGLSERTEDPSLDDEPDVIRPGRPDLDLDEVPEIDDVHADEGGDIGEGAD